MDIGSTILEIAINLFEGWLFTYVLHKKLTGRHFSGRWTAFILQIAAVFAIGGYFSMYLWVDMKISDVVVWGIVLVYAMCAFSDRWYVKAFWTAVVGIVTSCIAGLTITYLMAMTGDSWSGMLQPSIQRTLFLIFSNLMLYAVFFIITRIKARKTGLSWLIMAVFLGIIVILFASTELLFSISVLTGGSKTTVLAALTCLLIAMAGIIALYEMMNHQAERQGNLKAQLEIHKMTEAHIEEVQSMYAGIMEYRHDIKHQLAAIQQLAAEGNAEESRLHVSALQSRVLPEMYATGCTAVDALLTAKTMKMRKSGIDFEYIPYPLNELPVDTVDFCSILGNILDNAIEGIMRLKDHKGCCINLEFAKSRDMLYITCKNPADTQNIVKAGDRIVSSKSPERYGLGIPSVKRIVDNAEGMFTFETMDDSVYVKIALPYISREK